MLTSVRLLHARTGARVWTQVLLLRLRLMHTLALAPLVGKVSIATLTLSSVCRHRARTAVSARTVLTSTRALAQSGGRAITVLMTVTSAHRLPARTVVCAVSPSLTRRSVWTLTHALVRLGGRGRTALATWMSVRLLRA